MQKLTQINIPTNDLKLTQDRNREVPFILCFKYKLQNKYTFKEFKAEHNRVFQAFLDKVSNMTVNDVDKLYLRHPDHQDTFRGLSVQHYTVNEKFRIHGVFENGEFVVLRLDTKHQIHKC